MSLHDDIMVYFGVASGQQISALKRLEPEGVMISHATVNNKPWEGNHKTFIDCGGYHHMMNGEGEYGSTNQEYVAYLLEHGPELFALRDYPCEPDLLSELGRSVADQQRRTTERHVELLNMIEDHDLSDRAVGVVQGWSEQQYVEHVEMLRDHGALTDYMAIGSVCRRNADADIANAILAVRDALPDATKLHAFGVKGSVLRFREVVDALDSVDSAAYDYQVTRFENATNGDGYNTWRDTARSYLNWRHELKEKIATESLQTAGTKQFTLGDEYA